MKQWTGKVAKKFARDFQGTKLYSFQLDGVDRWFRTGKEELPHAEGTTVTFSEKNSQVLMDTVAEGSSQDASAGSTEETAPAASNGSSAPTVGQRMAWEAARRDAARIVTACIEVEGKGLEILPWNKNVAKAKRLDLIVSYIHRVAKQLMEEPEDE